MLHKGSQRLIKMELNNDKSKTGVICASQVHKGSQRLIKMELNNDKSKTGVIYASQASQGQSKTDQNGVKQ